MQHHICPEIINIWSSRKKPHFCCMQCSVHHWTRNDEPVEVLLCLLICCVQHLPNRKEHLYYSLLNCIEKTVENSSEISKQNLAVNLSEFRGRFQVVFKEGWSQKSRDVVAVFIRGFYLWLLRVKSEHCLWVIVKENSESTMRLPGRTKARPHCVSQPSR